MPAQALPNIIRVGSDTAPAFVFANEAVRSVSGVFGVDVVGNELTIDQITAVVRSMGGLEVYKPTNADAYQTTGGGLYATNRNISGPSDLTGVAYGTPVWWHNNGRLMARSYINNVERVGRMLYRINCVSEMGLIARQYHVGGIYTGQTFQEVATEIIGGAFAFSVLPAVADVQIYGWLPYATRRKNLHTLLFCTGAAVQRDTNGQVVFAFLSDALPATIPDTRMALGGSVDYEAVASGAEITEHAYLQAETGELVTLFDNTAGGAPAAGTLVRFDDAPVHSLAATAGLTIDRSGVNFAVLTGAGVLTGRKYLHNTRVVARYNSAGTENIKHVQDMTLVSIANSENVAKRVLAYYSSARSIRADLELAGESCGDILQFNDPFYEPTKAFLASMEVYASGILKASAVLVEGYTPTGQGNNISGNEMLHGSGTWTSPIDGEITVVLIGGGQGGYEGNPGENSPEPSVSSETYTSGNYTISTRGIYSRQALAGAGGEPGAPGEGGRIYVFKLSVTKGQQIVYSCGVGGAGAVYGTGQAGELGTDTTFGDYTSASGAVVAGGYIDPITGQQLAAVGEDGVAGNSGVGYIADGDSHVLYAPPAITVDGVEYVAGNQGEGAALSGRGSADSGHGQFSGEARGGFGGGNAYGANGGDGESGDVNAYRSTSGSSSDPDTGYIVLARGGKGADATPKPKATVPGRGGPGGNGGGGGGAPGWPGYIQNRRKTNGTSAPTFRVTTSRISQGGAGSDGGQGADGAILIYH